ncbi:MAG: hypothetical protein KF837_07275 [Labilithrix sp.]|nr:hypothetical protein [Labilithrix sp.]
MTIEERDLVGRAFMNDVEVRAEPLMLEDVDVNQGMGVPPIAQRAA